MPILDNFETLGSIQFITGVTRPPTNTFDSRARTLKNTLLVAVERAATDFKPRAINAVLSSSPPDLNRILTTLRTDCTTARTAFEAATNTQRTALNALVTEAVTPLTAAANIQPGVFALLQPILNAGQVDSFWTRCENYLLGQLITLNNRKLACIRAISNSVTNRINSDPSREITRTTDLLAVGTAVDAFKPSQSTADVSLILTPLRAATQTALDRIRNLPVGSPEQQTEIITLLTTFSKGCSDNLNTNQATTNTNFNTAITNINRIMTPPAPATTAF